VPIAFLFRRVRNIRSRNTIHLTESDRRPLDRRPLPFQFARSRREYRMP
jgi:hypothetical protein